MHTLIKNLLNGQSVEWKTLGEVCFSIKTGLNPRQFFQLNTGDATNYYVTIRELQNHDIVFTEKTDKLNDEALRLCNNRSNLEVGDILFSGTGTIGTVAIITEEPKNWNIKEGVYSIKPIPDKILSKFLLYLFESENIRNDFLSKSAGGTVKSVPMKELAKIKIPIPPLPVQQKIVQILDAFTTVTAELTAELNLRVKQYQYYRDKLLNFSDNVEWKTLGEVAKKISSGGTPKSNVDEYYNGDIAWLRTQEVNFNEIWDTGIKITESGLKNSSAKWIPANCVIVAMYGATVGRIAINKIPLTTNQACANIELDENILNYRFVYYYLASQYEYIKSLGTGSQTNINAQTVKNLKIPIPPLEIQTQIVAILDKFDTLTHSISEGLPREIELRQKQYEYYRALLLGFE